MGNESDIQNENLVEIQTYIFVKRDWLQEQDTDIINDFPRLLAEASWQRKESGLTVLGDSKEAIQTEDNLYYINIMNRDLRQSLGKDTRCIRVSLVPGKENLPSGQFQIIVYGLPYLYGQNCSIALSIVNAIIQGAKFVQKEDTQASIYKKPYQREHFIRLLDESFQTLMSITPTCPKHSSRLLEEFAKEYDMDKVKSVNPDFLDGFQYAISLVKSIMTQEEIE